MLIHISTEKIYTYINNQRGIKLARENYSLYKKNNRSTKCIKAKTYERTINI